MSHGNEIRMATWNIQSGGYSNYAPKDDEPVREQAIQQQVKRFRQEEDIQGISLIDTFGWRERYGHDRFIAHHLGFRAACLVSLDDDRLNRMYGESPSVVFATDAPVHEFRELDLGDRQGLDALLDLGKYGLQVASVYLDDMSEEARVSQVQALAEGLERDIPTILQGDFNMLRADMSGASLDTRLRNFGIEVLARLMPNNPLGLSIKGMNERRAISLLESKGFNDADPLKRPTAPARLPAFGIDYVFHDDSVRVDDLRLHRDDSVSDHVAMTYRA